MATLQDLLGPEDRFQLHKPTGEIDIERTREFLGRPLRPPMTIAGGGEIYGPTGPENLREIMRFLRANPGVLKGTEELRQAAAERAIQQEMELTRRASLGDQRAAANLAATKQREEIEGRPLKRFTTLASSLRGLDPDLQNILASRAGFNLTGAAVGELPSARKRREGIEKEKRQQRSREEMFAFQNLGSYVNKQTGEKASELAELPDLDTLKRDYVSLKPKQLDNIDALHGLDNQIEQYEGIIDRLNLPDPGLGVIAGGFALKARRLAGSPTIKRLDAIRSEITQLARAFGGDARVSDQEMQRLEGAVVTDFESEAGAKEAIQVLKEFRAKRAKTLGIPGLMKPPPKRAPQKALDFLEAHPDTKDQFKERYGYLPPGF